MKSISLQDRRHDQWNPCHRGALGAGWGSGSQRAGGLQARSLGKQYIDALHNPSAAFTFGDFQQQWGIQTPGTVLPVT